MAYKEDSGWNDALELKCLRIMKLDKEHSANGAQLCKELSDTAKPPLSSIQQRVSNYAYLAGHNGRPNASSDTRRIHDDFGNWPIPALDDLIKETEANGNTLPQTPQAQTDSRPHPDTPEDLQADLDELKSEPDNTTRQRLTEARLGQGKFRDTLMQRYGGRCPITDISISDALVASHIKPWRDCNNEERLDPNNGILLAAHIDRLFDRGHISFDEDGRVIMSNYLENDDDEFVKYGIDIDEPYFGDDAMEPYMAYHRAHIFNRGKK